MLELGPPPGCPDDNDAVELKVPGRLFPDFESRFWSLVLEAAMVSAVSSVVSSSESVRSTTWFKSHFRPRRRDNKDNIRFDSVDGGVGGTATDVTGGTVLEEHNSRQLAILFVLSAVDLLASLSLFDFAFSICSSTCVAVRTKRESSMSDQSSSVTLPSTDLRLTPRSIVAEAVGRDTLEPERLIRQSH